MGRQFISLLPKLLALVRAAKPLLPAPYGKRASGFVRLREPEDLPEFTDQNWPRAWRGFARGIAQAGVLKVLEERNISIHCVAGVSAGSLAGAAFSSGASAAEIAERF